LNARQLSEWEAYDRIDPIGGFRLDYEAAAIQSQIQNIALAAWAKKGSKPEFTTYKDFMPLWGETESKAAPVQSVEQMKEFLLAFATKHNKRINRTKNTPPSNLIRK
jgi:hypothetical protein